MATRKTASRQCYQPVCCKHCLSLHSSYLQPQCSGPGGACQVDLEGGRVELAVGAKVPCTHRTLCIVDGQACPHIEAIEAMHQALHTFSKGIRKIIGSRVCAGNFGQPLGVSYCNTVQEKQSAELDTGVGRREGRGPGPGDEEGGRASDQA
eukprot:478467-Rhodomonas_salina.7